MALPTRQPPQLFRPLRKYACTETLSLDQGRETNPSSHQLTLSPEIAARIAKSDASRQKLFLKKTVLVQDPDSSKYNTGSRTCHMELTLNVGRLPNWTFRDIDTGSSLHFPIQDLTATAQVFLVSNRTGENSTERVDLCLHVEGGCTEIGCLGMFELSYPLPATLQTGCVETLNIGTVLTYALEYLLMVDAAPLTAPLKRKHSDMSADL